jgi:hypothetical protein
MAFRARSDRDPNLLGSRHVKGMATKVERLHAAERQIATGESDFGQSGDLSDHEHDRRDLGGKDRQQDQPGAYARPVVPPRAPARAVAPMAGWLAHPKSSPGVVNRK